MIDAGVLAAVLLAQSFEQRGFIENRTVVYPQTAPNDSGRVGYTHTNPVAGVLWRAAPDVNAYVNWGVGFETPTFIELAYRPVGSGLNSEPQRSHSISQRRSCSCAVGRSCG